MSKRISSLKRPQFFWGDIESTKDVIGIDEVTRVFSIKMLFLKILQNSQENTSVGVSSSMKPPAHNYIRKETPAQVFFCEFSETFKNTTCRT